MLKSIITINKSINISSFDSLSFCIVENKKIIVLSNIKQIKYFLIPDFIVCKTTTTELHFICILKEKQQLVQLNLFFNLLLEFKKRKYVSVKKKLKLKGLGFRINLSSDLKFIELKLGYSHSISILIPENTVKVTIQKNILIVEGFDKVEVGNFLNRIRLLKTPDSYKGKGFWYPYEKENLKVIKKK